MNRYTLMRCELPPDPQELAGGIQEPPLFYEGPKSVAPVDFWPGRQLVYRLEVAENGAADSEEVLNVLARIKARVPEAEIDVTSSVLRMTREAAEEADAEVHRFYGERYAIKYVEILREQK